MDIHEITKQIVRQAKGDVVAIAYEGNKVEFNGEVWYELTIQDHGGYYKAWYALFDDEICYYDQDRIAPEDRIPAIDEAIANYA